MHVDLIGTYRNYIRQQQPCGASIWNNFSLTCMTIIDPAKGWFKIVEIIMINLDEVTAGNNEYTDKLSARVCQMFNNTCYVDTRVHAKSFLTTDMILNKTSLLC